MRTLCCQIQIDRLLTITEERITEICRKLSDRIGNLTYESGDDDGRYVNLLVDTEDAVTVWDAIQASFLSCKIIGQEIRAAAIVTITGRNGWNGYLLLHHFDPLEPLDKLDNAG